jgi:hypothetical protein
MYFFIQFTISIKIGTKTNIFEQKNFSQKFLFFAHSVKCNIAELIICSILNHSGPKHVRFG